MQTRSVDDVQAMLTVERRKDLLGCDSTTCMAELAGAFGADLVLYGEVGSLGASQSWTVSVLQPATGRVAARSSIVVRGNVEELAARTRTLAADLVAKLNESAAAAGR